MEEDINKKNFCPICENKFQANESVCTFCGYDFKTKFIAKVPLKNYLANLKPKDWIKKIVTKKNFHEIQIEKMGFASTNPEHGWSFQKSGDFLDEHRETARQDIELAKTINTNSELMSCRNKTAAKKRLHKIKIGIKDNPNLFEFEAIQQDYLSRNWGGLPFFKNWKIYKQNRFSKGKFDTKEIGEMDFLAKHRTEPKWLVIELKKDQSSDSTVGQILRYMGWVKRNLAKKYHTIEGIIIAGSDDDKMQYALMCADNVTLKIYQHKKGKLTLSDPKPIGSSRIKKLSQSEKNELLKELKDRIMRNNR